MNFYTDGACAQNGDQAGGWGVFYENEKHRVLITGNKLDTTNNQMEMSAVLAALIYIKENSISNAKILTDSAYIHNCFSAKWYLAWEKNGWRNSKKEPVKNKELWQSILAAWREIKTVTFIKVKGHANDYGNNIADELAVNGKKDAQRGVLYEKNISINNFTN